MAIKIITDSASDITQSRAGELGIEVLPISVFFGEEEFLDGATMTGREFFERLIETDELPHTSQISPFRYERAFEKAAADGDEVICIVMSSKLSGSYQSAVMAAEGFDGHVRVIDSENVAMGEHILVLLAVRFRDEGRGAGEIADLLEAAKKDIRVLALLDTLEYLKKGGRISTAAAFAGGILSIKPVVAVEDGEVRLVGKARGSKNGNNLLRDLVKRSGGIDFDMPYMLGYSGLSDELLQKYIADSGELYEGRELPVSMIGSTIGTYTGPGAVGAAFFVKNRI